jgi:predicted AlkP superfamily pyrophosphatase or phosphodiesterase
MLIRLRFSSNIFLKFAFIAIVFCCFSQQFFAQKKVKDLKSTVILISLDGFRYDYLDKYQPKILNELAKSGVRAKWLIPSFPTKTFPNHYTIATGLYPQHHGIIENNIYDRGFDAVFGLSKREEVENPRWWLGEPIWITAEKQGQKAATFFFPGTETDFNGVRPSIWKKYEHTLPFNERVDTVLSWFDLPKETRPNFFTLYFDEPDSSGHNFGPDSEETGKAVAKVDEQIGRLVEGLKKRKIYKNVNIIIVSDHGMAKTLGKDSVLLDDYFDFKLAERMLWTSEIVQIFPKENMEDEIISGLSKITNASCWRKSEIPERLHYTESSRIAPIICSAAEGWTLTNRESFAKAKTRDSFEKPHGAHGYDNKYQSMQATFIAHGKAFKKGFVSEPFENIQVYNLMCKILGLQPAKNDGDFNKIKQVLR